MLLSDTSVLILMLRISCFGKIQMHAIVELNSKRFIVGPVRDSNLERGIVPNLNLVLLVKKFGFTSYLWQHISDILRLKLHGN